MDVHVHVAGLLVIYFPQTAQKLVTMFKSLGVHFVFDTTFSRDLALIERQGGPKTCTRVVHLNCCCPLRLVSLFLFLDSSGSGREFVRRFRSCDSPGNIPMLASACPGQKYYALSPSYTPCTVYCMSCILAGV